MSSSDINGNSTSYTYDGNGNLSTLDGSGGDSTYTYTPESLVHTIVDPSVATTTFSYVSGHDQELQSVAFPDGVTENYGYDNAGRATSYVVTGSGSPAPTLISDSYSYTGTESSSAHDENKLASFTSGGVTWNYGYNANEYLASAASTDGGTSYSYTYDDEGNVTSQDIAGTTTSYSVPDANEDSNTGFSYNADGDETADPTIGSLSYNAGDQTSSITPSGGSSEGLGYLTDGQTALESTGSTTLTYNALGVDSSTTGSATSNFLRAGNGQLVEESTGSSTYYYLLDPQGTVAGLAGSSGGLADQYSYSPVGKQTTVSGTTANPYGYDSGYEVPGTSLLQFGQRYYNPNDYTWTQLDPTGQNPGYQYAGDDPINETDLTGEESLASGCADAVAGSASIDLVAAAAGGQVEVSAASVAGSCAIGAAGALVGGTIGKAVGVVSDIRDAVDVVSDSGSNSEGAVLDAHSDRYHRSRSCNFILHLRTPLGSS